MSHVRSGQNGKNFSTVGEKKWGLVQCRGTIEGGEKDGVVTFTSLTVHKLPNPFTHVSIVSACWGGLVE